MLLLITVQNQKKETTITVLSRERPHVHPQLKYVDVCVYENGENFEKGIRINYYLHSTWNISQKI